jgi:hypothetical protein
MIDSSLSREASPVSQVEACRVRPKFSIRRFALFAGVFLAMVVTAAFVFLSRSAFGVLFASTVCYSSSVVLYTFSSNRGLPGYFFRCPLVQHEMPRMARLHVGFLFALFCLQEIAIRLLPYLPKSWLPAMTEGISPYTLPLFAVGACLALIQIFKCRSLLVRAHKVGSV